jgi:hypothetical protein
VVEGEAGEGHVQRKTVRGSRGFCRLLALIAICPPPQPAQLLHTRRRTHTPPSRRRVGAEAEAEAEAVPSGASSDGRRAATGTPRAAADVTRGRLGIQPGHAADRPVWHREAG